MAEKKESAGAAELLRAVSENRETVMLLVNTIFDRVERANEAKSKAERSRAWFIAILLGGIVAVCGVLVAMGRMSEIVLVPILTLLVGYLMRDLDSLSFGRSEE